MVVSEESVRNRMKLMIESDDIGHLYNINDFRECGPYSAIRTVLVDFCKSKVLERVFRGIYVKPGTNKRRESYLPDDITLAKEIDRKNGSIATPKGKTLDYVNGIISEKPKVLEFYSTGSGRTVKLSSGVMVKYLFRSI